MSDAPQPVPEIANYELSESVGYLLSRVRSTLWNNVTQLTMADLGITSTQASIMFMLASGRSLAAADQLAESPSGDKPSIVVLRCEPLKISENLDVSVPASRARRVAR